MGTLVGGAGVPTYLLVMPLPPSHTHSRSSPSSRPLRAPPPQLLPGADAQLPLYAIDRVPHRHRIAVARASAISAYIIPRANILSISCFRAVTQSKSLGETGPDPPPMPDTSRLAVSPCTLNSAAVPSRTVDSSISLPEYFYRYPVAPAFNAPTVAQCLLEAVSISTRVSSKDAAISRQPGMPSFNGIRCPK